MGIKFDGTLLLPHPTTVYILYTITYIILKPFRRKYYINIIIIQQKKKNIIKILLINIIIIIICIINIYRKLNCIAVHFAKLSLYFFRNNLTRYNIHISLCTMYTIISAYCYFVNVLFS